MNRIYCAIGKIIEITQDIEEMVGDICRNSEIIKEFGSKFGTFVGVEKGEGDSGRIRFSYGQTAQIEQQQVQTQKQVTKQKEKLNIEKQ